jgi:cytoskeleton protein RodZ
MSENLAMQDTTSIQENSLTSLSATAGQMLRQARLDAGLHIAALAVSLRVPVKRIEALENGQMDLLPDMVFVRALTSSICQVLKIDALPILDKLPKAALPRLNRDDVAINTPIGSTGVSKAALLSDIITSPLLMGVLLLCIGAAGIYFWPKTGSPVATELIISTKTVPEAGVNQAKEVQVSTENTASTTVLSVGSVPIASPVESVVTAVPVAAVVNSEITPVSTLPTDNIVTFKASAETWVEVKNASGSTSFKKLLAAGDTAGASGVLPLTVIVGRADVTQVEVRGKTVDLNFIAKSNVARFEVN